MNAWLSFICWKKDVLGKYGQQATFVYWESGKCNMSSMNCQIFKPFSQPVHPHWGKRVCHPHHRYEILDKKSPSMILEFSFCHFPINVGVWKRTLVFRKEVHVVFCWDFLICTTVFPLLWLQIRVEIKVKHTEEKPRLPLIDSDARVIGFGSEDNEEGLVNHSSWKLMRPERHSEGLREGN